MSKFLIQIKKTLQFFVAAGVMFASPATAQQELSIESQAMQEIRAKMATLLSICWMQA